MSRAIVLVPGMSCVASVIYAPLIEHLASLGIQELHPIELSSVDPTELLQPNPLEADIATIRAILKNLVEERDLDVLLVAHSYGGAPSLAATEGLWQHLRAKEGKKGGITRIALISSAVNLPGDSVNGIRMENMQHFTGVDWPAPKIEMTDKGLLLYPVGLQDMFFGDFPAAEAEHWASTLRPHALEAVMTPSPPMDPRAWKAAYLLTEEDGSMPVGFQEMLIERAREAGAQIDVERIKSGHFPQINHVEELGSWIQGLLQ